MGSLKSLAFAVGTVVSAILLVLLGPLLIGFIGIVIAIILVYLVIEDERKIKEENKRINRD